MAQRKNIFHNFINNPFVYKIIQKIMSGTSFRRKIIKNHIRKKNLKILDIGCGPAEILDYIQDCEYYGYDIDKRSIEYAKKKYLNKRYRFFCKIFNKKEISKLPKFDYIILFGILHHMNNDEVNSILNLCKKIMKKNCKILTEDPILIKNQNMIAKFLIQKDRGTNVRNKNEYLFLLKSHFKIINYKIVSQLFIPYTWFSAVCKK